MQWLTLKILLLMYHKWNFYELSLQAMRCNIKFHKQMIYFQPIKKRIVRSMSFISFFKYLVALKRAV